MKLSLPSTVSLPPRTQLEASRSDSDADVGEAAKQFEQLLVFELLKTMRQTTMADDDAEGDAFARDTVMSMFDESVAETVAGSFGLVPMLSRQLGGNPSAAARTERGLDAYRSNTSLAPNIRPSRLPRLEPDGFGIGQSAHHDHASRIHCGVVGGRVPQSGDGPVDGEISSHYGWRSHPISGERKFHSGMDIAAPEGTEIRAVAAGRVRFAGEHRGYGNLVELEHADGAVTRYAHASRLYVRQGDLVDAGEAIADVGSTGVSTGPHLHFEVRRRGAALDPQAYLRSLRHTDDAGRQTADEGHDPVAAARVEIPQ